MDKFYEAIEILKKKPRNRTVVDLYRLEKYTKLVTFFTDLRLSHGTDVHRACLKCMRMKKYENKQEIIRYGDEGDSFCILLRGSVKIKIPRIDRDETEENDENQPSQVLFRTVAKQKTGSSFGELALIYNQRRNATIIANEPCWICFLMKNDYHRILGNIEQEKHKQRVIFLTSFPMFKQWSKVALSRISLHFNIENFKKGNVVYSEGEKARKVYFIKSGQFRFMKRAIVHRTVLSSTDVRTMTRSQSNRVFSNKELQIALKADHATFGEAEILENQKRQSSWICDSPTAEVYSLSKLDFLTRLQPFETMKRIQKQNQIQQEWRQSRLRTLKRVEEFKESLNSQNDRKSKTPTLVRTKIFVDRLDRVKKRSLADSDPLLKFPSKNRLFGLVNIDVGNFETHRRYLTQTQDLEKSKTVKALPRIRL